MSFALRRRIANSVFARKIGSSGSTVSSSAISSMLNKTQRKNRNRRARDAALKPSSSLEIVVAATPAAIKEEEEEAISPFDWRAAELDLKLFLFNYDVVDESAPTAPLSFKAVLLSTDCNDVCQLLTSAQNFPALVPQAPASSGIFIGVPKRSYKTVVSTPLPTSEPAAVVVPEPQPIELVVQKPAGVATPWVYKKLVIPDVTKNVIPRVIFLDEEDAEEFIGTGVAETPREDADHSFYQPAIVSSIKIDDCNIPRGSFTYRRFGLCQEEELKPAVVKTEKKKARRGGKKRAARRCTDKAVVAPSAGVYNRIVAPVLVCISRVGNAILGELYRC